MYIYIWIFFFVVLLFFLVPQLHADTHHIDTRTRNHTLSYAQPLSRVRGFLSAISFHSHPLVHARNPSINDLYPKNPISKTSELVKKVYHCHKRENLVEKINRWSTHTCTRLNPFSPENRAGNRDRHFQIIQDWTSAPGVLWFLVVWVVKMWSDREKISRKDAQYQDCYVCTTLTQQAGRRHTVSNVPQSAPNIWMQAISILAQRTHNQITQVLLYQACRGKGLQHLPGASKGAFSLFYVYSETRIIARDSHSIFWNSDYRQRFPLKIDWNLKIQILTFWCIDVSSNPALPHPWFAISIENHPAQVVLTMSASARFCPILRRTRV